MKSAGTLFCIIWFFLSGSSFALNERGNDRAVLLDAVDKYYSAFEAKSLTSLGVVVHPDIIVLEGTYKNIGWSDYRDNHIGSEMKEWKSFRAKDRKLVKAEVTKEMGYVIMELSYEIVFEKRTITMQAVDTFVLVPVQNQWRVKHIHSSTKKN